MSNTFTYPIAKKLFLFSLLVFFSVTRILAVSANPKITSFSPSSGAVGTSVTISGSGFNSTASSNIVFFGATMATVTSGNLSSLTVTVPAGATYAPITVLNSTSHLSGSSKNQFIVTFTGTGGISTSTFGSPQTFATGNTPIFVAIADIDGDGKPDIVVIDQGSNNVGVYLNKSSGGNITSASFAAEQTFSVGTGAAPSSIAIGDIDGDGKLDVVTTDINSGNVSVLRNTSSSGSISFAAHADFSCGSNTDPNFVAIADFDGDGKPDLAVTDEATSKVSVFLNTTTSGGTTITFAAHADFGLQSQPGGIAVGDFDGDGKLDIAATIGSTTQISVLHNTSTGAGNINFGSFVNFTVGNSPIALTVSDVDGDGKLDIVVANAGDGTVSILRNSSSSGAISFVGHQDIIVDNPAVDPNESFFYIQMNDLDGDGKPDMIVVDNDNALYLLKNNSTSGSPSFGSVVTVHAGTNSFALYGIAIGDLNSDGKPDMIGLAQGDNQIDVLQNNSITPTLTATTTSLSSNNNPSFSASPGNVVTFTATVTHSGTPVSEGTVSFTSNGVAISGGTNVAVSSGQAIVNTSYSSTGSYTIVATFNGDANYSTSTSTSFTQQVNLHPTTISSLTAVTGTTTNASTIQWTATFAASISGLSTADFSLNTSGVSGASIASVSGSGTSWTITVNTGSGDGTIQLAMNSSSGVTPTVSNTTFNGTTYTIDKTAPTIGISSPSVSSVTTGTSSVTYTVTYGDAHFNSATLSTSNITLNSTGGASGSVAVASNSSTSYTVTISGITGTGTLGISIAAGTATDLAGNAALASGASTSFNVVLPTTTVTELVRNSSNPTQGGTVSFLVTFADAVSGLSAADFTLATTGSVSGASIGTISGSGTTYAVNVNTGTGEGTVTLNFTSSSGLDHTVTNNPFNGQAFTIDQTPPSVTSVALPPDGTYGVGGTLQFVVTFSEPVTVNTAGGTPYIGVTLNTGGTVQATYISGSTSQQLTFTYTVVSGNADPDGIAVDNAITFNGATFSDFAGNFASSEPLTGLGSTSGILVDAVPPVVNSITKVETSPTNATSLDYTVTFNKPVIGVGTGAFSLTTTGTANGAVNSVTPISSSVYTVNVIGISGDGTLRLDLSNPSAIFDFNSNQMVSGFTGGDTYTIDNTAPTAAISAPSVAGVVNNGTGSVSYTITYADANFNSSNLTGAGITLNTTGTATGTVNVSGSAASYTVTISSITGTGSLGITLAGGYASDLAGNSDAGAGPSATFKVGANDDALANLTISNGALTPGFSASTYTYTDAIANLTSGITVLPTADDPNAAITVNGNPVVSGVRSSSIPMSVGANTVTIVVTAADGVDVQTYTITVNRPLPNNAVLSSVSLSPTTTLINTTGPGNYNYTAAVANSTTSIQVLPTTQDGLATITVNGSPVATGTLSQAIALNVGANTITTVVTAQDGVTTKTYIITVTRAGAAVASLSNLAVSPGTLSPVFATATNAYVVTVPYTTSSIFFTPTTTDPNATITVNGVTVASGSPSGALALSVGNTTVATVITAQNGVTKQTYNTVVTRLAPSGNALLTSVTTTPMTTLVGVTGTGYLNYTAAVSNSTTSIQVTPTATDPTATITVNGQAVSSGTLSQAIALNVGANTITTVLTAQDGVTTKTVIITVNRAPSSNAALANLSVNTGTLSPAFATATNTYSVSVPNTVTAINITPTAADGTATVTVNGSTATSGSPSNITLALGLNAIPVVVTAQDGMTTHTYTVNVTRVPSSNAALTSISLTPATSLVSTTGTGYYNYKATVANSVASIEVTPTVADATATVTVNGSTVASGSLSQAIALNVGANTITTVITAQDGVTTRTAVITVTRTAAAVASLAGLTISSGTLSPAFATATINYTASVTYPNASVTIIPTTTDPNATVTVNGSAVTSGIGTAVALSVGLNKITTVVTAQNGVTKSTYTTYITRAAPSTNALYTSIALSPASTLTGVTGPGYINYTAAVPNSEASVQVIPTAQSATATITVNGQSVTSGTASQAIALNVGANTITTVITAQDGVTSKTAIITVTRAMPAANNIYDPISVTKPAEVVTLEDGITVHQAVSPNGDGINDYLTIDGIANYPNNSLMIVDRNGAMVYQAKGYDNSSKLFDGHSNINGKMQLPGTYFYSLDYTAANGEAKHKTGYIILKY